MHLHLNPLGGLAGDMFCAALLSAFPEHLPSVREALVALDLPQPVDIDLVDERGPLGGKRFRVTQASSEAVPPTHTAFADIRGLLERAPLQPGVRSRSLAVFSLLARAEGRVHGVEPDAVTFHEVGSWDSIADIVSAVVLLEALGVTSASCAPVPLGSGTIRTAHGVIPIPSPASALLLEGLPVTDDGIPGERVTPTGAALLRSLDPARVAPHGGTLRASGRGFGERVLPGIPNCLQIVAIDGDPAAPSGAAGGIDQDRVVVLGFEVDDQTPEDFALALEQLRSDEHVLSVTSFQGVGKAGRPTSSVEVLARPEALSRVAEACFRETTTIGLRWQLANRALLRRRERRVRIDEREIAVKLVERPAGTTAKAELRDLAGDTSQASRERLRRLAERQALDGDLD